jgi:hypothetical protein
MLVSILFLIAIAFVAYAVVTQYSKTPAEIGIPKRVWASIAAAAGAIGAAVMAWFA